MDAVGGCGGAGRPDRRCRHPGLGGAEAVESMRTGLVVVPGSPNRLAPRNGQSIPADRNAAFAGDDDARPRAVVLASHSWYRRQATSGRVLTTCRVTCLPRASRRRLTGSNTKASLLAFGNAMLRDRRWIDNVARNSGGRHPSTAFSGTEEAHRHRHPQRLAPVPACRAELRFVNWRRRIFADLHTRSPTCPAIDPKRRRAYNPPDPARLCRRHRRSYAHLHFKLFQQDDVEALFVVVARRRRMLRHTRSLSL